MEYTKGDWKITESFGRSKFLNVYVDAEPIPEIIAHKIKKPNAQLIASAPDLYEALKYLDEHCSPEMFSNYAREKCRKALAKATGK